MNMALYDLFKQEKSFHYVCSMHFKTFQHSFCKC